MLSLILVGLPELSDRLSLRRNRSLQSRIHHRLTVGPLTLADTAAYVALRLKQAGITDPLFAPDALARLHETTLGVLRDIDRIAAAALRDAARKKRRIVEGDLIDRAESTSREAA